MSNIMIQWLGLSCYKLTCGDATLVLDPYTGVRGFPEFKTSANAVYCSHQHGDHGYVQAVDILPYAGDLPFAVTAVDTFHDDAEGTKRGPNLIHVIEYDGIRVAHCGDLGHPLSEAQIQAIGRVDALLVPVGGFYTIDAQGAKGVCDALQPRVVIPMHYREGEMGHDGIETVEPFLSLWEKDIVSHPDTDTIVIEKEMPLQVVQLTWKGEQDGRERQAS